MVVVSASPVTVRNRHTNDGQASIAHPDDRSGGAVCRGTAHTTTSCPAPVPGHRVVSRSPSARPRARTVTIPAGASPLGGTMSRAPGQRSPAGPPPCQDEEVVEMADVRRLPGPNADLWDWQLHGACRGM